MKNPGIMNRLRPAFDEIGVYFATAFGVVVAAPVVAAAIAEKVPKLRVRWWDFVIALVVAWAVILVFELKGTKESKRKGDVMLRRYSLGFFAGVFWRIVIPAIGDVIGSLMEALKGTVG